MSLITRTYTFSDGTTAYGSQVESEIANLANTLNNLDAGTSSWDLVKAISSASTPLIADNSSGSNTVFEARVNGSAKFVVGSTGALTISNGATISGASLTMSGQTIAMGSNKITGLANGSTSTDAAAYGQTPVGGGTITNWATFTPLAAGFGTLSNQFGQFRRVGDTMEARGWFSAGTVTAATATLTLPSSVSLTIPSTANSMCGFYSNNHSTNPISIGLLYTQQGTDATKVYFASGQTSSQATTLTGSAVCNTSDIVYFSYTVPISGWSI